MGDAVAVDHEIHIFQVFAILLVTRLKHFFLLDNEQCNVTILRFNIFQDSYLLGFSLTAEER